MRAMPNRTLRASRRATLYAAASAGAVLLTGRWVATSIDGAGFSALGIAAATLVLFAPLAALIGAVVAYWPLRRVHLDADARFILVRGGILLGFATAAVYFFVSRPLSVTVLALGSAVLVIVNTALAERTA